MTVEFQPEIKKSDERWHASCKTKINVGACAFAGSLYLGFALATPHIPSLLWLQPLSASFALAHGGLGGVLLIADAMSKNIRETPDKQKSN